MKTYNIQKHDGNLNGWKDTFTVTGQTKIEPYQAAEFNQRFETTGIKYVEAPTAKSVVGGMVSQTSASLADGDGMTIPGGSNDSKPTFDTAKDAQGQDIDLTHSFQKPGTGTEMDHGTLEIQNEDGNVITDNATALQDGNRQVPNDTQINSDHTTGQHKAGEKTADGKTYRKVTQPWLDKNPDVTGIKIGDLYPM